MLNMNNKDYVFQYLIISFIATSISIIKDILTFGPFLCLLL